LPRAHAAGKARADDEIIEHSDSTLQGRDTPCPCNLRANRKLGVLPSAQPV
jgi:hypothetical protein